MYSILRKSGTEAVEDVATYSVKREEPLLAGGTDVPRNERQNCSWAPGSAEIYTGQYAWVEKGEEIVATGAAGALRACAPAKQPQSSRETAGKAVRATRWWQARMNRDARQRPTQYIAVYDHRTCKLHPTK